MDLKGFLAVLTKRWLLVLVATLAVTVVVGAITVLIPPTYEAQSRLFISTQIDASNPNQQLFQGGSFSVDRVKSYTEVAASPRVLEPVIQQLGLDTTPEDLASQITTTAPAGTVLLQLEARDTDAAQAAALANATASQLSRTIEELETPSTGPPSPVRVSALQQAVIPYAPVWPSVPLNLLVGVLAGLLLGVGVALLRERLDVTVKSDEDLARVTDLPVLGTVPFDEDGRTRPLVRDDPFSSRAESYRRLRTSLQFAFVDDLPRVVAVTSAVGGEGKSSVAGNLALSLQQLGVRTCLVDGDLRRPSVAEYFGLVADVGLTTALIGRAGLDDVSQTVAPGLDVVPSGPVPPNPAELLASHRLATLLDELQDRYDTVLIDCSPVLPVADASIVATRAGGVMYVVHVGSTTRHQVELALRTLVQVNARVLGTVLNMVPARGPSSAYYADYRTTYRPQPPGSNGAPAGSASSPGPARRGDAGGDDPVGATSANGERRLTSLSRRRPGPAPSTDDDPSS